MSRVVHPFAPIFNSTSKTLILGTMPSVKSRENCKYYGNPNNRFWPLMEGIYQEKITDWKEFILRHNLALWDVLASCEITSSSDASIKNPEVNDIKRLIDATEIKNIVLLGKTAYNLYEKYIYPNTQIEGICLPSPSPANAKYTFDDLLNEYKLIKEITE